MSKAKFAAAKELIEQKKYDEARAILKTIDHPTATKWLDKLDRIALPTKLQPAAPKTRMFRVWRTIWGVLTLLSLAWLCYGLLVSSSAYEQVTQNATSEAAQAGVALGASMGVGLFLCTGLPFLLIFGFLYWRNGVAMRNERQHAEMLRAVQR